MLSSLAIASSSTSAPSSASAGAASRRKPLAVLGASDCAGASRRGDPAGERRPRCSSAVSARASIAHVPPCSDASISSTSSGCRSASPHATLTDSVDFPTPPLLLRKVTTRPCTDRSRGGDARKEPVEHRAQLGSRQRPTDEIAHLRPQQLDDRRAFRLSLLEPIQLERRDDGRTRHSLLKFLCDPDHIGNVTIDVDQDQLRLTRPSDFERLAVGLGEVENAVGLRDARQGDAELFLERRIASDDQDSQRAGVDLVLRGRHDGDEPLPGQYRGEDGSIVDRPVSPEILCQQLPNFRGLNRGRRAAAHWRAQPSHSMPRRAPGRAPPRPRRDSPGRAGSTFNEMRVKPMIRIAPDAISEYTGPYPIRRAGVRAAQATATGAGSTRPTVLIASEFGPGGIDQIVNETPNDIHRRVSRRCTSALDRSDRWQG